MIICVLICVLIDLMILEHLKNSMPECNATYISEHKVRTAAGAAALADDYVLTHGGDGWHSGMQGGSRHSVVGAWSGQPV